MRKLISSLYHFFIHDLWKRPIEEERHLLRFLQKVGRSFIIGLYGFIDHAFFLRASSLTFYSLMSIVPTLVISFAIAKGFGLQSHLTQELKERFPEQQEVLNQVITLAQNWIENSKEGLITLIGIAVLVWSVIKVMSNIEASFNTVWRIKKHRSWVRRFTDFMTLIVVGPLFFITASSVTLFIVHVLKRFIEAEQIYSALGETLIFFIKCIPFALIWILFFLLYLVMPNTKVKIIPALLAGIIAGSIFQLVQWTYIHFQIGANKYGALYGSFAALPLFLAWLQVSWLIVLFGAQFSYAYQNIFTYEYGWQAPKLNMHTKLLVSLWIMHRIVHSFIKKEELDKKMMQKSLRIPMASIDEVINELRNAKLIVLVQNGPCSFYPTKPSDKLMVSDVIKAVMETKQKVDIQKDQLMYRLEENLHHFENALNSSNLLLKEI